MYSRFVYTYHNLKVLLKSKFSGKDLSIYVFPLGRYSFETLNQLVETQDPRTRYYD